MNEPGVYVVRVYRHENDVLSGVIESVSSGERTPFHTSEELWCVLRELSRPQSGNAFIQSDKKDPL